MLMLCADSEDVLISVPRHSSGWTDPILKYIDKSCRAPLVISINEEMPGEIEDNDNVLGREQVESEPEFSFEFWPQHGQFCEQSYEQSPRHEVTASERFRQWLWAETVEEEEEEEKEVVPLPEFDAHFLAYPQTGSFSMYRIPVLCMADEKLLPVVMAALLRQRHIWHIDEPLIGIQFSTYDTSISLFVGWLGGEVDPGYLLVGIMTFYVHFAQLISSQATCPSCPDQHKHRARFVLTIDRTCILPCPS